MVTIHHPAFEDMYTVLMTACFKIIQRAEVDVGGVDPLIG
jgi:hypothetical protein